MRPPWASATRITPTAHYTAEVWYRSGLSHRALTSARGRLLHAALAPLNWAYAARGHRTLDAMLLARHRLLDARLAAAIDDGRVGQVLELAAGLSPRGFTFARRHPALDYVESDLPPMAAHKQRLLDGAGLRGPRHRVVALDALADDGPDSLAAVTAGLDRRRGLAVVTEGLLPYLDHAALASLLARVAATLRQFRHGLYLCDVNLRGDLSSVAGAAGLRALLQAFTRGRVRLHFASVAELESALAAAGFARVAVHEGERGGPSRRPSVRVAEAWTG